MPSIPDEQSLTLMIERVLGDLTTEVETADVREVEGEGSSSTLGDNEGEMLMTRSKLQNTPEGHAEYQVMI